MRIQFLKLPIENGVWHCLELNSIQLETLFHFLLAVVIFSKQRVSAVSPLLVLYQPLRVLQYSKYLEFDVVLLPPSIKTENPPPRGCNVTLV